MGDKQCRQKLLWTMRKLGTVVVRLPPGARQSIQSAIALGDEGRFGLAGVKRRRNEPRRESTHHACPPHASRVWARYCSSSSSIGTKWNDVTTRLLQDPSFTASTWHEAQEAVKYWAVQQEQLDICWQLLDQMASQSPIQTVPDFATNAIVNLWRRQFKQTILTREQCQSVLIVWPSQVAKRLARFESINLISLDEKTHAMILDAASHCVHNPKEGVYFAEDYLQRWMELYRSNLTKVAPDVVAVGSVVHAWVESGAKEAPRRAENYLDQVLPQLGLQPNEILYTSVIAAWAKVGNPRKAQLWLRRMQQDQLVPDIATWNTLLSAWARDRKDSQAAEQAEGLLHKMRQLYESGQLKESPDVVSYSIALDAWAKKAHRDPNAAKRAQSLFDQMQHKSITPNLITYNTVLMAHGRAGDPRQAERLLQEMMSRGIQPDVSTCSAILSGWGRIGTLEAAERAEAFLRVSMPQMRIQPNIQTYSNVIHSWAKASKPNHDTPVQRAQGLFEELEQRGLVPDVVTYTALMNAYGRHGQPERAQTLLEELNEKYQRIKNPRLRPNVQSFTTVLSAWSHSKKPKAPERAEALLLRMADRGVEPNVFSYSTVLDAWAKSNRPDAADRAQAILDRMQQTNVKPNVISFTTVVKAYAKQGKAEEAEALLQQMLEQQDIPQPDVYTFSSVLYAWSKSESPQAAERAESILVKMHELYESKLVKQPPNVVCYSNVLACWAKVPGGAERTEAILRVMENRGIKPNLISYNTVVNAWANETKIDQQAVDRVYSLLEEVKIKKLQPDEWTYRAVWKAIGGVSDRAERGSTLIENMAKNNIKPARFMVQQLSDWAVK